MKTLYTTLKDYKNGYKKDLQNFLETFAGSTEENFLFENLEVYNKLLRLFTVNVEDFRDYFLCLKADPSLRDIDLNSIYNDCVDPTTEPPRQQLIYEYAESTGCDVDVAFLKYTESASQIIEESRSILPKNELWKSYHYSFSSIVEHIGDLIANIKGEIDWTLLTAALKDYIKIEDDTPEKLRCFVENGRLPNPAESKKMEWIKDKKIDAGTFWKFLGWKRNHWMKCFKDPWNGAIVNGDVNRGWSKDVSDILEKFGLEDKAIIS